MHRPRTLGATLLTAALLLAVPARALQAPERGDPIPPRLPKDQRDNLLRFLQAHEKPDRFVPADAKVVDAPAAELEGRAEPPKGQPVKQYMVQITSHRPVPGQEEPKNVDVYYYRPNPEKGKPGITVKHTVDLTTGQQVGPTEVLLKHHAPLAREELAEAVALAREKAAPVQALYKGRDESAVRWEYLQLLVTRKQEQNEPGDRVVRIVFTAAADGDAAPPAPVPVVVNLTKGVVVPQPR
jgi:hypothetical protein